MVAQNKIRNFIFTGLNASPKALKETMLPNISPGLVADATVQIFGGYDGRFGVSIFLNSVPPHQMQ